MAYKHFFTKLASSMFRTVRNTFASYYYFVNNSSIIAFFRPGAIRLAARSSSGSLSNTYRPLFNACWLLLIKLIKSDTKVFQSSSKDTQEIKAPIDANLSTMGLKLMVVSCSLPKIKSFNYFFCSLDKS